MIRTPIVMLVLAILLAAPAVAQQQGQLEAGLFLRFEQLDRHLELRDAPGIGGRLGFFFLPRLAVEADLAYAKSDLPGNDEASIVPFHARLLYDYPAWDKASILFGAGYSRHRYGEDLPETVSDDGFGALFGFRVHGCGPLSVRFEGTWDHYGEPDLLPADVDEKADNWGVQVGLSLFLGKKASCDADGDGVRDDLDECPDTPRGVDVDSRGCPEEREVEVEYEEPAPRDSDGDGVIDDRDLCPDTPRGERVDARGCPEPRDSDGDGVEDDVDRCPETPRGTEVDRYGCPRVFEEGKAELVLEGVFFELNEATLLPESRDVLDRVAASLANYPDLEIEVAGHTDSSGSRQLNTRLSQARAEAVRDYLIGKGVGADQLTAKGYGPERPIADNATVDGRARNRRVELRRLD